MNLNQQLDHKGISVKNDKKVKAPYKKERVSRQAKLKREEVDRDLY